MSSTREETVNSILDQLFINGAKQKADRLLLIQEDHSGAAQLSNARYLGGYSRLPVRDILLDALRQREIEVRERLAKIQFAQIVPVDQGYTVSIGSLGIKLCGIESAAIDICNAINQQISGTIHRDSEAQEGEQSK